MRSRILRTASCAALYFLVRTTVRLSACIKKVPERADNRSVLELAACGCGCAATTEFATRAEAKSSLLTNGPAAEVTPPARAAGPHLPPEASAEAQPTRAWPARPGGRNPVACAIRLAMR